MDKRKHITETIEEIEKELYSDLVCQGQKIPIRKLLDDFNHNANAIANYIDMERYSKAKEKAINSASILVRIISRINKRQFK